MNALKLLPKTWAYKIGSQITASLLKVAMGAAGVVMVNKFGVSPDSWQAITGDVLTVSAGLWAALGSATHVKIPLSVASDPTTKQVINSAALDIKGREVLPPF